MSGSREEAIRRAFNEHATRAGWDLGLLGAQELAEVAERAVAGWDREHSIEVRVEAPASPIYWDDPIE